MKEIIKRVRRKEKEKGERKKKRKADKKEKEVPSYLESINLIQKSLPDIKNSISSIEAGLVLDPPNLEILKGELRSIYVDSAILLKSLGETDDTIWLLTHKPRV